MKILNSFIVSNSSHFFGCSSDSSLNSLQPKSKCDRLKFSMTGDVVDSVLSTKPPLSLC